MIDVLVTPAVPITQLYTLSNNVSFRQHGQSASWDTLPEETGTAPLVDGGHIRLIIHDASEGSVSQAVAGAGAVGVRSVRV